MTSDYSLFNAMDGSIGLGPSAFDQSLVLNLLFQERILVYDGSFFTCLNLLDHLKRRPGYNSLFEVACQRGLVVPAFRDGNVQCLRDSAKALKKQSSGYELQEFSGYRNRVIRAVDSGISSGATRPFYWPANAPPLGEGYNRTVRTLLQRENPPEYIEDNVVRAGHFDRVWDRTARWRTEVIDIANRRTVEKGQLGLQRQEIYNALGRSLGISSSDANVTYSELQAACSEGEDKIALGVFMRWLAQCHFVNQARAFDISINFPVYHYDEDFILDSILRSPLDAAPSKQEGFRCEVLLPSFQRLAQADPADLMAMRVELGADYLSALKEWQAAPDDANLENLQSTLRFYCEEISARYKDITPVNVEIKFGKGRIVSLTGAVTSLIGGGGLSLISHFTKLGFVIYKVIAEMRKTVRHTPTRQELEVTLPVNKQNAS